MQPCLNLSVLWWIKKYKSKKVIRMVMRISGLASGMDIDEIVTNLMKAERIH